MKDGQQVVIFLAHSDVVFPDLTPLPIHEDQEKLFGPGIGDNTTSLVCLLEMARFITEQNLSPDIGILFVANSCEEGLGNLRGTRQLMHNFKGRIREVISVDGWKFGEYTNDAVGSKRYRVTIKTEGGHSYGAFGNRNAIYFMSSFINTLYQIKPPAFGKTTYNVGTIEGGTSVNTIAQNCSMLYEYRSDKKEGLAAMDRLFTEAVQSYQAMGIQVEAELLGDRPCRGVVDTSSLEERYKKVSEMHGFHQPRATADSTDCNIPLSLGIPAICFGVYEGYKAHSREEYIIKDSVKTGIRILADFLLSYFPAQ